MRWAIFSLLAVIPAAVSAQSAPSDFTTSTRYDIAGRVTGTIAPDPDGAGSLHFLAVRNTYDAQGNPIRVESGELAIWQPETVAPANWTSFTIFNVVETTYDARGRKTKVVDISGGSTQSVTQFSYDAFDRVDCTAVRMNPAAFASVPADACVQGTPASFGLDRISRNHYDSHDRVVRVQKGLGTPLEQDYVTYTYSGGLINYSDPTSIKDANGNLATMEYGGSVYSKLTKWTFPSKSTAGQVNSADYEAYTYDANGNRLSLRKRDGSLLAFTYDALNRITQKTVPERAGLGSTHTRDVFYDYDLRGLQVKARFDSLTGTGVTYAYDGFGRAISETQNTDGVSRTVTSLYDANGNRTRVTHPDGQYFQLDYDGLNRATNLKQLTTTLGTASYNTRGLPSALAWSYGAASANARAFGYDAVGRLASIGFDLNGTSGDVTWSYTRNPASQIATETQSNDAYSWNGHVTIDRAYSTNGLNQYVSAGSASFCYDANGNLTADGASVYLYDVENRLVEKRVQGAGNTNCAALAYTGALQAELSYDPTGRLYQVSGGTLGTQRFAYDGNAMIGEYNSAGTLLRRYVHGSNVDADDPLIVYEGSTVSDATRRYLHADPRGSIVAVTDYQGTAIAINSYDEFGIPDNAAGTDIASNGRFRYTGQAWLPELGMYYYKARIYSPTLGRFLQTDPIGYEDQFNLYAYVANDPVNKTDFTGLCEGENCPINVFHPEIDRQVEPVKQEIGRNVFNGAILGASLFLPVERAVVAVAARTLGFTGVRLGGLLATRSSAVLGERLAIAKAGVGALEKGGGKAIMGAGTKVELRQGERLAAKYGGEAGDYAKVTTGATKTSDGASVQVHAYRNVETGKIYEPKLKIQ